MYFERYAKELAPSYNMARDLFLLQNVFPEAVATACAERGVTLPDDTQPNIAAPAADGERPTPSSAPRSPSRRPQLGGP